MICCKYKGYTIEELPDYESLESFDILKRWKIFSPEGKIKYVAIYKRLIPLIPGSIFDYIISKAYEVK